MALMQNANIRGDKIFLGDIARIESGDPVYKRKLEAVVMGRSPLPGKSRIIGANHIAARLRQNKFNLSNIRLGAVRKTVAVRDFTMISKAKIEKCVKDFIYENMPWERERATIKNVRVGKNAVLPSGKADYKADIPKNTRFLGSFPVAVSFYVDGKFEKKIWTSARMEVITGVVAAAKPIGRYKPISKNDLCLRKMDISSLPSNAITNIDEAVGKRTKRKIDVNSVIRADMIEIPPLIRRGDVVTIIAESESLRITTLGKAREKGRRGDRIKVVNINSKKELFALVLNSNTVAVNF